MKLHMTTWKETNGFREAHFAASEAAARSFGVEKKKELKLHDGNVASVEHKIVDVSTDRTSLIVFLNHFDQTISRG